MLDALGRRLRFAPPQPKGEFIRITERDVSAFEAINRHGPLPIHYLHEYAKGNLATLKRKVSRLTHGCGSAWNKDPVFGVIGIQTGPR